MSGKRRYFPRLDDQLIKLATQKYRNGRFRFTATEIAFILDIPVRPVWLRLNHLGLSHGHRTATCNWKARSAELEQLAQERVNGLLLTVPEIAKRMGVTTVEVERQFYKRGWKCRREDRDGRDRYPSPRRRKRRKHVLPPNLIRGPVTLPPLPSLTPHG